MSYYRSTQVEEELARKDEALKQISLTAEGQGAEIARLRVVNAKLLEAGKYLVNSWIEDHEDASIDEHNTKPQYKGDVNVCGVCLMRSAIHAAEGEK